MEGRRNLVLFSVLIGTLMSAIDTTIVILALPTITSYFKADLFTSIWIIIIYLLIVAVLTTQLGGLGDIFGRGKIFNAGFLIFIAGSAASGFSPGIIYLIAFRGVQAVGAALMQANSNAIIADYFGPQERGKAFGYTSMGWSIGGTLGIVLGGIITTFLGWQYIFFINIPIGLFGFILGIRYIRDNNKREAKIDFVGMGLLTAILSFISYGATDVAGRGVNSFNMLLISLGILLLVPFIIYERYPEDPVIKLDAFKVHSLSLSLTASLMQALGYLSVIFLLIMYLQGIRGYNPLEASLLLVPGYIISSLISPKMGKLSDRIGAPIVASVGIFLMAVAVLIYLELQVNTAIIVLIIASIISGIGGGDVLAIKQQRSDVQCSKEALRFHIRSPPNIIFSWNPPQLCYIHNNRFYQCPKICRFRSLPWREFSYRRGITPVSCRNTFCTLVMPRVPDISRNNIVHQGFPHERRHRSGYTGFILTQVHVCQ